MLKIIFYIQIALAVICDAVACAAWFFMRPLANFDSEQANLEKLISQKGHFPDQNIPDAIHYFTTALYNGGQVSFYVLQVTCIWLIVGGIMGLKGLSPAQKGSLPSC